MYYQSRNMKENPIFSVSNCSLSYCGGALVGEFILYCSMLAVHLLYNQVLGKKKNTFQLVRWYII